jgi:hypothetical protein
MREVFTTSKRRVCVGVVIALILGGQSLKAGIIWDSGIFSENILRTAISGVKGLISLAGRARGLPLRTDGSGDGDGSDGSGSGDGSSGDGTGDSTSTDSTSTAASDDPGADPDAAPTTVAVPNAPSDPTDPTPTLTPEINAIMSIPTTDPRGNAATLTPLPATTDDAPDDVPVGALGASGSGEVAPVDVGIHAVIVSGAMTPWDAIGKVPGVGTVTVTGGIVALGTTPIRGEPPGGGPQPSWLRLVPDLNLLDGSVIPPVVPNVIDVRITRYSIEAVEKPNN